MSAFASNATANDIRAAVDQGLPVYWSSSLYQVIRDHLGRYFIVCTHNNNAIGLTHQDKVTLNGRPGEFYVAEA